MFYNQTRLSHSPKKNNKKLQETIETKIKLTESEELSMKTKPY